MPDVLPEAIVTDVGDALFLTNNPKMHQVILEASQQDGLIANLASNADPKGAIDDLFIATLGRHPDASESGAILEFLQRPNAVGSSEGKISCWQNVVWAVLTSAEFRFNH